MLEEYDQTLPYRLGLAALFFLVMGVRDWIKHPENPTRLREYEFLLSGMVLWILYGIVHDHITATISPEYFLQAKGLASSSHPFRWAVTLLATKATYGPGALMAALFLITNNPKPNLPQLPYGELFRLCLVTLALAGLVAVLLGLLSMFLGDSTDLVGLVAQHGAQERSSQFMLVWGIHFGSYIGAVLGTVWSVIQIGRRRKAKTP